jgi:hypothetical protein
MGSLNWPEKKASNGALRLIQWLSSAWNGTRSRPV